MILPTHYATLRHQNPSAFLIELYTAELYLKAFEKTQGGKPNFQELATQLKGNDSDETLATDFANFLELVYDDLKSQPQGDSLPRSQMGKELLEEMEKAHKKMIDEEKGNPFYKALYYPTLPALIEIQKKDPQWEQLGEVARYQKIVFTYTLMELSGRKVSKATNEALEKFSILLNALGELMMKRSDAEKEQSLKEDASWTKEI